MEHIENIKKKIKEQIAICNKEIKYYKGVDMLIDAGGVQFHKRGLESALEIIEREFNPDIF